MFGLPLKLGAKIDVIKPARDYLTRSGYSTADVERVSVTALSALQDARNACIDARAPTEGSLRAWTSYYGLLRSVMDRIPASEAQSNLRFNWSDSLRPRLGLPQCSWQYERACALHNIAALESQLAALADRSTTEDMSNAIRRFCTAASILTLIKDQVAAQLVSTVALDQTEQGLGLYINLLLAQAQAVGYELATATGKPPEVLAKVAGAAADFYRAAAEALQGPVADLVEKEAEVPWRIHCLSWAATFDGASFFQQSKKLAQDAKVTGKGYGVEIAWLRAAEAASAEAANVVHRAVAQKVPRADHVDATRAASFIASVQDRRREVERDNDKIYYEPVPKLSELPDIPRAVIVRTYAWAEPKLEGADPFSALMTPEVSAALSGIEAKLEADTRATKEKLLAETQATRKQLTDLGMPGMLDAAGSAQGLPAQLSEQLAACAATGGARGLEGMLAANGTAAEEAARLLNDCNAVLSAADSRGQSNAAAGLRADLQRYQDLAQTAAQTDSQVRAKLESNRALLAILDTPAHELERSVATGAGAQPRSDDVIAAARSTFDVLMAELREVDAAARMYLHGYDRVAASERLSKASHSELPAMVDALLSDLRGVASKRLDDRSGRIRALLADLEQKAHSIQSVRGADPRAAYLQRISDAVAIHAELSSHLQEGRVFWFQLVDRIRSLLSSCHGLASPIAAHAPPVATPVPQSAPSPPGDAVGALVSMGFPADVAAHALAMHRGDFNAALNLLLTQR